MKTRDPFRAEQEKRERQTRDALAWLNSLKNNKITLKRPAIFVPGWTDEAAGVWRKPHSAQYACVQQWIRAVVKNKDQAHIITFTKAQSRRSKSFLDLGDVLKRKIWRKIGKRRAFDLIGHSMGGLDAIAAITDSYAPLKNVNFLITVATPHQGRKVGPAIAKAILKVSLGHHFTQLKNLSPEEEPIKSLNLLQTRRRLLSRVNKLYYIEGTRDLAVMRSGRYNLAGLPKTLKAKAVKLDPLGGARHSEKHGITQDPRMVAMILKLLLGQPIPQSAKNYGYIYRANTT